MPESEWPKQPFADAEVSPSDPEVKAHGLVVTESSSSEAGGAGVDDGDGDASKPVAPEHAVDPVLKMVEHYSSWYRLKKAVAWLMRARRALQAKAKKPDEVMRN